MKLLFGGLPIYHQRLIRAVLKFYNIESEFLPEPDYEAFLIGRKYCSRGFCNPAYFTIGNLIKFLLEKKKKKEDISQYVYVTVGACGPCRFGMYIEEYKKALKLAGLENFKIAVLDQENGYKLEGIEIKKPFWFIWDLGKAIMVGDILRSLRYKLIAYRKEDVTIENIDQVLDEIISEFEKAFEKNPKLLNILKTAYKTRSCIKEISLDLTKKVPKVMVIGEFWASSTEGYGNYKLHEYLLKNGFDVKADYITNWITYQFFIKRKEGKVRKESNLKSLAIMYLLENAIYLIFEILRKIYYNLPDPLVKQKELYKLALPYYDPLVVGGEGHLEVAKHIWGAKNNIDFVISVKPFGCMPSTQSDAINYKVSKDYNTLFISVETSGDGEVNVKNRVSMKMFEAKKRFENKLKKVDAV